MFKPRISAAHGLMGLAWSGTTENIKEVYHP